MYKTYLKYILIILILFGLWNVLLGYFPFLLFFLFIVLMISTYALCYKSMKETNVSLSCDHHIVEREEKIQLTFSRENMTAIQCGKIIAEYSVFCQEKCLCHRQVTIEDQDASDVIVLPHCGYYTIEISQIQCFDVLQCFYKKKSYYKRIDCYVFPTLLPVHFEMQEHAAFHQEADEYSPYHKGDDYAETFDVRPYRETDSLRHIHWKISMKKNELHVKEGSMPILKNILFMVQFQNMNDENDQAMDMLYSVCLALSKRQIPFELLCPQTHTKLWKPELINHQDYLKECIKRILQTPTLSLTESLQEYPHAYIVTAHGIEVYKK